MADDSTPPQPPPDPAATFGVGPPDPVVESEASALRTILMGLVNGIEPLSDEGSVFARLYRLADRQLRWGRQTELYTLLRQAKNQSSLTPLLMGVLPAIVDSLSMRKAVSSAAGKGVRVVEAMVYDRAMGYLAEGWDLVDGLTKFYGEMLEKDLVKEAPPDMRTKSADILARVKDWDERVNKFVETQKGARAAAN